jgi:hypothetical protein
LIAERLLLAQARELEFAQREKRRKLMRTMPAKCSGEDGREEKLLASFGAMEAFFLLTRWFAARWTETAELPLRYLTRCLQRERWLQ